MTNDRGGWDEGPKIRSDLGDVERGTDFGVPPRVSYQQLSEVADGFREKGDNVSETVREGLRRMAEEIHNKKKKKNKK